MIKKIFLFTAFLILLFYAKLGLSQNFLFPAGDVCAGDVIEYSLWGEMIGVQQMSVQKGIFVVADSLYEGNDSTKIKLNCSYHEKISIKWGTTDPNGKAIWHTPTGDVNQTFRIGIAPTPTVYWTDTDTIVENGQNSFTVTIDQYKKDETIFYDYNSSNITKLSSSVETIPLSTNMYRWTFTYQITGDQNEWVKFRTRSNLSHCSSTYSDYCIVDIKRKLTPPTINGDKVICNLNITCSLTNIDSKSQTHTWTCTNGLRIYKNGQYLTTYTGTETSVAVNRNGLSGEGIIKVKSNGSGYVSSIENEKKIWCGEPDPDDFYIEVLDIYGNSVGDGSGIFEICENESYSFYLYPLYVLPSSHHKYGITQTNFYPDFGYTTWQSSNGYAYISVDNFDTESSGILNINSVCNNNIDFIEMGFVEGSCGGYFLMMTPNPSSGETTISIESISIDSDFDTNEEWDLEIYDQFQNLKEKKLKEKGRTKKIKTQGWNEGTYIVRAKYKDKIITGRLLVKK